MFHVRRLFILKLFTLLWSEYNKKGFVVKGSGGGSRRIDGSSGGGTGGSSGCRDVSGGGKQ